MMAAVCIVVAGCSPRLVPVGTGGLLTRSYDNYSQSTVMRSEAIMASQKPADGRKTEPPKREYTYSRSEVSPAARQPEKIAPASAPTERESRKTPAPTTVAPRAAGIPKATEAAVSGLKNVTFVTQEQAAVVTPSASARAVSPAVTSAPVPAPAAAPASAPVKAAMTAREQKALDRERRQKAKQLLAQRETASRAKVQPSPQPERQSAAARPVATTKATAPQEIEETTVAAVQEVKSISIEEALARVTAIPDTKAPDHKPVPTFTTTPDDQRTVVDDGSAPGALAPAGHNFKPNETEHVKFSYYDPFGSGNNRFVVVLDEQRFCYPYPGKFLSGYGARGRSMHTGIDIKGIKNDTIRAAFSGTVRMSKPYSGYGNCVVIRHRNGLETLYSHNSRNLVRVGQTVQAGQAIALVGRTGQATTEHCHFEVRIQGQHINPALLVDYDNRTLRAGVLSVSRQGSGRIVAVNRSSGLAPSEARDVEDAGIATPTPQSVLAAGGGETRSVPSSSSSTSSAGASVHTVKSGDTLWAIARRYGTTVAKICTLNGLEREATLPLGKKIKLR